MKRSIIAFLMIFSICIAMSGCNPTAQGEEANDSSAVKNYNTIDVDLTILSTTMVYSEVYHMMISPDSYIGKTVKIRGQFAIYHDSTSGNNYYAVIISDATACCQQGIEFVLGNDKIYPDDYPPEKSEITVQGVFQTYKEGENLYCHLINAEIVS